MPGRDGTGPIGNGPGSGRAHGQCGSRLAGVTGGATVVEIADPCAPDRPDLSSAVAVVTAGGDCLGCAVCESVCPSGALVVDVTTSLPVIDESSCTGCGECVHACVRDVLALRPR